MTGRESDDARFEELIAREFPGGLTQPLPPRPLAGHDTAAEPGPAVPSREDEDEAPEPSGFRSWTPAEEPDEPFTPPQPPPAGRWTVAGRVGTALVVLPMVLVVASAFGIRFPMLVATLAGLALFAGVVLLLHRLRRRPPVDGDGAVL
ncbi:MAG: hypothetical protein KBG85_00885 [Micropruina sp.]|nr:hypothetical protein [Micropruina sp.]